MGQGNLFGVSEPTVERVEAPVVYLPKVESLMGYSVDQLAAELPLRCYTAHMYGKSFPVPRLECWIGPPGLHYAFGGRVLEPGSWTPLVTEIKARVEALSGAVYHSCFVNLYRSGDDTIAYHSDDEAWMGEPIASVSFGVARKFTLKHKRTTETRSFKLGQGDLLIMLPGCQAEWVHTVPREAYCQVGSRINLTFRPVKDGAR